MENQTDFIVQPLFKMTRHGMIRKLKNDFWSITGDFIYHHHVEPRAKLYMPKEELFPIPLKYIDVTRTTHTSLDILLEKHIDDCWTGERDLSDAWTGVTRLILMNERPPDGCRWSGVRLMRKQNNLKTRQCMARYVQAYV